MGYRITKIELLHELTGWNTFLRRKIHLIACGGTALTLLNIKPSTKDIDFIVPTDTEYTYLSNTLKDLGYKPVSGYGWSRSDKFVYDLFAGNRIHTTELLESPLKNNNNIPFDEYTYIYLGILNFYDLIISKIFRGTDADFEDCFMLIKTKPSALLDKLIHDKHVKEFFGITGEYDLLLKLKFKDVDDKKKAFEQELKKLGMFFK